MCKTNGCKNKGTRYCSTCRTRRQRKNSPFKYYYGKLKYRAKERGKDFNLALEQFKLLWLSEPEKWKQKLSDDVCKWQMDRIKNYEGYHFDNIQIIHKQRNIMKYHKEDKFHMEVRWVPKTQKSTVQENEKAPF